MKLLLDENISFRIVRSIVSTFPDSIHIGNEGIVVKEDFEIFDFAKVNNFTIVTFDEDFYEIQPLKGYPPKIIWLRFGNSNNLRVISKLLENQLTIISFLTDSETAILEIY